MNISQENLLDSLQFMACDASYADAETVIFGAPFDGTTSFRPGTRFASQAMRRDFAAIETYSPKLDLDLEDYAFHDAGDLLLPYGNPASVLAKIHLYIKRLLEDGKRPAMLGGEHLVTLGAIEPMVARFPDLHIIHFDAHTDLREAYLDESLSHATVIRKCWDLLGDGRIHSFGIRSGLKEEFIWAREHLDFHPFGLEGIEALRDTLHDKPVYITLDLDVLDPSVMPGTGTPEPGGVSYNELHEALISLGGLKIVGFDINELSPPYDPSGISTAVACKLLRELLLLSADRS